MRGPICYSCKEAFLKIVTVIDDAKITGYSFTATGLGTAGVINVKHNAFYCPLEKRYLFHFSPVFPYPINIRR